LAVLESAAVRGGRRWTAAASLACSLAALAGCGGEAKRSVAGYCDTYAEQKAAYIEKYSERGELVESTEDPLASLLLAAVTTAEALGDIRIMFDKLSEVSPEEITPDINEIRDSMNDQLDSISGIGGNPLLTIAGSLFRGLVSAGSWRRFSDYTVENCGSA
jgi:hypothetical protein